MVNLKWRAEEASKLRRMTITRLLTRPHAGARSSRSRPHDKMTPGAPDALGARPPGTPALDRQRLFPDGRPDPDKFCAVDGRTTTAEEPAHSNAALMALVRSVLPDCINDEVRACITDPHAVLDLHRARESQWLTQHEFEEELLRLFVHAPFTEVNTSTMSTGADPSGLLTPLAPSTAGYKSWILESRSTLGFYNRGF